MNSKDKLYFTFKNIVNEYNKIKYFQTIQMYLIINNHSSEVIQHFNIVELSHSWWNKTIIYIYYLNGMYDIINQIINIDNDNKKINKDKVEFNFSNGVTFVMKI